MITLAHMSDVHLAPLPPVRARDLLNKRLIGFINWKLKRQHTLGGEGLASLVQHMHEQAPDFVAITGDLVNLALDAEIGAAHDWLQAVGEPERVCICPGNHDAYVPGQLEKALARWHPYALGETLDTSRFPFVRRIGEVAVVSCNSAIPTLPFLAAGRFDEQQQARLTRVLHMLGEAGYFRVVMIHHPPNQEASHPRYGLWGARNFRRAVAAAGAELILHGHTHKSTIYAIPGKGGDVPVIGVAAAGTAQSDTGGHDPARYNLFRIERLGSRWECTLREYGFQRLSPDIVLRLSVRIY